MSEKTWEEKKLIRLQLAVRRVTKSLSLNLLRDLDDDDNSGRRPLVIPNVTIAEMRELLEALHSSEGQKKTVHDVVRKREGRDEPYKDEYYDSY